MFSVELNIGGGVVQFQWYIGNTSITNAAPYSGVNTSTLTITGVDNSHEGEYRVRMSRGNPMACFADSPPATLIVCEYSTE